MFFLPALERRGGGKFFFCTMPELFSLCPPPPALAECLVARQCIGLGRLWLVSTVHLDLIDFLDRSDGRINCYEIGDWYIRVRELGFIYSILCYNY